MRLHLLIVVFLMPWSLIHAQKRPVTVIHGHEMYNYVITRYVPAWEIQTGEKNSEGLLSQQRQFFRDANTRGLQSLKDMLYSRGLTPDEVRTMDAETMESHVASKRLVIHYRVQYEDHSIFLAHLNNRSVRSVIPFRIEGGRWLLDTEFAETALYQLLSSRNYDPYMGLPGSEVVSSYGFEEEHGMTTFYDYSGYGNHATIYNATIVDGRFGGALKLHGDKAGIVTFNEMAKVRDGFSVDFHVHVPHSTYNREKVRRIFTLGNDKGGEVTLEVLGSKMRLSYPTRVGKDNILEWEYGSNVWERLTFSFRPNGVIVETNDIKVASSPMESSLELKGSTLLIGAENGVKATIDEFRVTL